VQGIHDDELHQLVLDECGHSLPREASPVAQSWEDDDPVEDEDFEEDDPYVNYDDEGIGNDDDE
jgi:hypothetical protein